MAFDASELALVSSVNGYGLYRYDTLDATTTVDGNGYMNNSDDTVNLAVGDIIEVVVWSTAVRTGTISDVGRHIVMQVSAAGAVDLSDDMLGATVATGD
jgi:putative cofactor-binding repeat protein